VKLFTRVVIKRAKRQHPEWTSEELLAYARKVCDPAGFYADTVALQDVKDVIASMEQPRRLI